MANASVKKKERALAVVISVLIHDGKILLIKRIKGDYSGLWGLPGGKIEKGEHLSEAAVREIKEESGIDSDFVSFFGYVSEHLVGPDGKGVESHFLLHLCELSPKSTKVTKKQEGELKWFDLGKLPDGEMIPSDFLMIEKMVKKRGGDRQGGVPHTHYYNCVMERTGDGGHLLKKFEPAGSIT